MTDKRLELGKQSLEGLWVGDCLGNLGMLYYVADILHLINDNKVGVDGLFQLSDDTEEAIVLYNHIVDHNYFGMGHVMIDQDKLAKEFAERYYTRDRDGEKYGYGLMTRKVLTEIYEGKPWREANQTKSRIEGPSFVDTLLSGVAQGKTINDSMAQVNSDIRAQMQKNPEIKLGSCGNGSAMRVAPLGPLCGYYEGGMDEDLLKLPYIKERAWLQAEVTHCHPDGIAGSVLVALASATAMKTQLFRDKKVDYLNPEDERYDKTKEDSWQEIPCEDILKGKNGERYRKEIMRIPLWSGGRKWTYTTERDISNTQTIKQLKVAYDLPFETPIAEAVKILGNGTHVTCQDTVPLCLWLAAKHLGDYKGAILETCMAFGDTDTNCAIVGGIVAITDPVPEEWRKLCVPMEGVTTKFST